MNGFTLNESPLTGRSSRLMRDLPEEEKSLSPEGPLPQLQEAPNPISAYVDSLDDKSGAGRFDPDDPNHHRAIAPVLDAIKARQIDLERVKKLARRSPKAAYLYFAAYEDSQQPKPGKERLVKYTTPEGVEVTETATAEELKSGGIRSYKQLHEDVIKLGGQMEEANAVEMAIDEVDKYVSKYPQGLPGTGGLKNLSAADYLKTEEGMRISAAISALEAEVIRKNAGLTQTASELERTKAMLGRTAAGSAALFIEAFKRLQATYERERAMKFNKLGPVGKKLAAERLQLDPDRAPWQIRKEKESQSSPKTSEREALKARIRQRLNQR